MKKLVKKNKSKLNANRAKAEKARIKRRNDKFAALTPAQKRVVIAQDVLAQMELGFIKAESGSWANWSSELPKNKPDMELQEFLKNEKSCEACGLGSLFICAVKLFDDLSVGKVIKDIEADSYNDLGSQDTNDAYDMTGATSSAVFSYLGKFFSKDQLRKIESAFEEGNGHFAAEEASTGTYSTASNEGANYFNNLSNELSFSSNEDLLDTTLKLKLIMQNIIKNKGTFKTDDKNKPKIVYSVVIPGF